jgi:hypothetical protein
MLFWILYLSSLFANIDSPLFVDILWLGGGATGILSGTINLIGCRRKHMKVWALAALFMGIVLLPLWALTMFISSM